MILKLGTGDFTIEAWFMRTFSGTADGNLLLTGIILEHGGNGSYAFGVVGRTNEYLCFIILYWYGWTTV